MNKDLIKRILSSVLLSAIIFSIIFFAPHIIFSLILAIVIFLSLLEFYQLPQKHDIKIYRYFCSLAGALLPFFIIFIWPFPAYAISLWLVFILISLFLLEFTNKSENISTTTIGISLFGIIYISITMSFLVPIKLMPHGTFYVLLLLAITKANDIFAYLIGTRFGRNHLIPRISPKKSIKGSLGGLIASIIVSILAGFFVDLPLLHLFFLGIVIGVLSQFGDLSESLIKRHFEVKDSGKIVPGFGGVLDLIDSLLFSIPAFYVYLILVK